VSKSDGDLEYIIGFDADMEKVDKALKDVSDKVGKGGDVSGLLGGILGNVTNAGKGGGLGSLGSSLGGVAGEMVGGPAGAAIGGAIGGKMGGMLDPIVDKLMHPIDTLTSGLEGLQGPLGIIGVVLPEFLTKLIGPLTQMAGLASPASLMLFNHALEDTQAVIGRAFVPVLDTMRDGVRLFGDVLASILPDTVEVNSVLVEAKAAFNEFRGSVSEAMGEFGPVIKTGLLVVIKALGDAAVWTMRQLRPLVTWIGDFFRPIREALGLSSEARSSVGAAARSANFSSFDEYSRKLQLAAFAGPSGASPEVRATNQVVEAIDKVHLLISRWWGSTLTRAGETLSGEDTALTHAIAVALIGPGPADWLFPHGALERSTGGSVGGGDW
jgi:hypothetical protein